MGRKNETDPGFMPPSMMNKTSGDFRVAVKKPPQTHTSTTNRNDSAKAAIDKRDLLGSLTKR